MFIILLWLVAALTPSLLSDLVDIDLAGFYLHFIRSDVML